MRLACQVMKFILQMQHECSAAALFLTGHLRVVHEFWAVRGKMRLLERVVGEDFWDKVTHPQSTPARPTVRAPSVFDWNPVAFFCVCLSLSLPAE